MSSPKQSPLLPDYKPPEKGPVYESQKACAAAEGLTVDQLRMWKNAGCPGFRSSRIYWAEVQTWIAEQAEMETQDGSTPRETDPDKLQTKEELQMLSIRLDCKRKLTELEQTHGKLLPRSWVEECIGLSRQAFYQAARTVLPDAANWNALVDAYDDCLRQLETEMLKRSRGKTSLTIENSPNQN